jgi:hypothetical protein
MYGFKGANMDFGYAADFYGNFCTGIPGLNGILV